MNLPSQESQDYTLICILILKANISTAGFVPTPRDSFIRTPERVHSSPSYADLKQIESLFKRFKAVNKQEKSNTRQSGNIIIPSCNITILSGTIFIRAMEYYHPFSWYY